VQPNGRKHFCAQDSSTPSDQVNYFSFAQGTSDWQAETQFNNSEHVSQRRHNDNHDSDHKRKPQSHLSEVGEGVPAGLLDHQVRLKSCGIDRESTSPRKVVDAVASHPVPITELAVIDFSTVQ
jgi:hypothetical protein